MRSGARPDALWAVAIVTALLLVSSAVSFFGSPVKSELGGSPISGYRVVYGIEDMAGERPSYRTEVVEVRRPYDGRLENRSGLPPGGEITSGKISNREFGWQLDDGGDLQFGLRRPSGGPTRDVSYASLRDAADADVIVTGGRGEALGRDCTWFVFEDPFPEPLAPPTEDSRVEACVDPAGVVLREAWTIHDKVARVIEAVSFVGTPPPTERFLEGKVPEGKDVTQPEALDVVRSQVVVGDDVGGRRPNLVVREPSGWEQDRDAQVVQASATGGATQFASLTYLRDRELVVVEIGLRPSYDPTWEWTEGRTIEVAGVTKSRVMFFGDHVELRVLRDEGFARINAPTRAIAVAFAEGLEQRRP